jgi:hypothetical protein
MELFQCRFAPTPALAVKAFFMISSVLLELSALILWIGVVLVGVGICGAFL